MAHFQQNEALSNAHFVHRYAGLDDQALAQKVDNLLVSEGYRLREGRPGDAVYERGNRTMRLLLGAFVKYFKFAVAVAEGKVTVSQRTSGMSGGLIGMSQVKNEMKRLAGVFQTL